MSPWWVGVDWRLLLQVLLAVGALGLAFDRFARSRDPAGTAARGGLAAGFWAFAAAACLLTWWGVLLAEIGSFGGNALTLPPIVVGSLAAAASRPRREPPGRPRDERILALSLVLVLVTAGASYLPTFEPRVEARDPGVYELTGQQLARTGSLAIHDELVRRLDPETAAYFFPPPRFDGPYESLRYLGFYLESRDTGRVLPQFLPGYPVWVAATSLAVPPGEGRDGAGRRAGVAAALLAAMGAAALIFAGAELAGSLAGSLAGLLLAVNFAQAWFARYSAAEMLAQFLVLTAVGALAVERRSRNPAFGLLAGLAFGLCWLTKAELFLLVVPLAALVLADAARFGIEPRRAAWMLVPLGLLGVHTGVHAAFWAGPYLHYLTLVVGVPAWLVVVAVGLGVAAVSGLAVLMGRWSERRRARCRELLAGRGLPGRAIRYATIAAILALLGYAYWIRPTYAGWDTNNLPELVWAVSGPVALLAVAGLVRLLLPTPTRAGTLAPWAVLLAIGGLMVWERQVNPGLLWAYRRWIPVLLPLTLLLAAAAWAWAWSWADRRRAAGGRGVAAGAVVAILLVVAMAAGTRTLAMHDRYAEIPELQGAARMLDEVGDAIPEEALILFEPRNSFGLLRLEAALGLGLDREVLRIPRPDLDPGQVREVVWEAARRGRPTYLLTTGYLDFWPGPRAIPVREFDWLLRKLEERSRALPESVRDIRIIARLYRLEPGGGLPALSRRLDVGGWDDLYVKGSGAWAPETDMSRTYRWTRGQASFWLPGLSDGAGVVAIMADPDTPEEMEPQRMEVLLDGHSLGRATVTEGWREYRFPIPDSWRPGPEPPRLDVQVDTFEPRRFGIPDARELGVKIDWIGWGPVDREQQRSP